MRLGKSLGAGLHNAALGAAYPGKRGSVLITRVVLTDPVEVAYGLSVAGLCAEGLARRLRPWEVTD